MAGRFVAPLLLLLAAPCFSDELANPLIDYVGFEENVAKVGKLRGERRVTEAQFIRMAKDAQTVVLDARSAQKFALLHIKGAKNLSLPDMTADELAKVIPSKTTRVLIYCNNNFTNEPEAFPTKAIVMPLNVHTFNVLVGYGYTNVYELGPLLDIRTAKLQFEGSRNTAVARANNSR